MTRYVAMDQLVRDLKDLAESDFPKDDIETCLRAGDKISSRFQDGRMV